ncbi:hypothetical protein ADK41_32815, partial [Streptomyces caelestis]
MAAWGALTAVVMALGMVALPASTATAATPVAGQTYRISVAAGNKCLEIKNGVPDDGALLQQW